MSETRLSDDAVTGTAPVKTPKTLADMLKTASRATELVPVCLRADVLAEIQKREVMIREAENERTDARLAGGSDGPSPAELAEEIRELEAVAADNTIHFTIQAVDGDRWALMIKTHQDDEGNIDMNVALRSVVYESIVSPDVSSADVDAMWKILSDGQRGNFLKKLLELNRQVVNVPKSLTAYMTLQETSGKRESGEK